MGKNASLQRPVQTAVIKWDDDNQPVSSEFDDFYFSTDNGVLESEYVFVQHNLLPERWQQRLPRDHFTIAETGFGTGLNFLVAWRLWQALKPVTKEGQIARLHFVSVEKSPLAQADLLRAFALWPELEPLSTQLATHYPPQPASGSHRLVFNNGNVVLTLYFGDATTGLSQFAPGSTLGRACASHYQFNRAPLTVDAWFLDGFSPAKNPDMWSQELFNSMAQLSDSNTTFATFAAASSVRRSLTHAGFESKKATGYGQKREMLYGQHTPQTQQQTPAVEDKKRRDAAHHYWHLHPRSNLETPENPTGSIQSALIIGGGLAGCQTASALANRGIKVTLLEKNTQLASEASGNRQGVVYTRLSPQPDPLSRFNLVAQTYANQFYSRNTGDESLFDLCGEQCGVVHLCTQEKQVSYYQQLAHRFSQAPQFCQWHDALAVSQLSGLNVKVPGLFLPQAGWLSPSSLCEQLTQHAKITVKAGQHVSALTYSGDHWQACDSQGQVLAEAECAIVANAHAAKLLEQTAHLPLKTIRGQVSHIQRTQSALSGLQTVLCGEGYVSPSLEGIHCVGATFNLRDNSNELSAADHQKNWQNLQQMVELPNPVGSTGELSGRVGFRTTTLDYFPIVGPVPKLADMEQRFAPLRHRANTVLPAAGEYYPHLYTHVGLGSRGLAYSPLCAELLTSLICAEPLPIDQSLYLHLHPARFLIRNLIRNKASTL